MKVGNLVRLKTSEPRFLPTAIIISRDPSGWFIVLQDDGTTQLWPESQMELV